MAHATFTERGLAMQGFPIRSDPSIRRIEPWLRLTPSLSTLWIAGGTALASPAALLGFAILSAIGASRHKHPFDRFYDRGIRRLAKSEPLPDNPPPRRFAMALAAAWAATAAALLWTGHRRAGLVAGGLLGAAGATVASTHFCVGSWTYRQLERLRRR
jgi:4-hydroxybenzoate polyprenyltransferase